MQPYALSIAGFDPSAGAGITSDIKTFEAHGVYGLGVCSAITVQNDIEFESVEWIDNQTIFNQTEILLRRFKPVYCKIGLIKDSETLAHLMDFLRFHNLNLVWDPILKASAGFIFHTPEKMDFPTETFRKILSQFLLVTPNIPEYERLSLVLHYENPEQWFTSGLQALLLKGGHSDKNICTDILYHKGITYEFENKKITTYDKHGTGCVLSSSIVARLALGENLTKACSLANQYVNQFIKSNNTFLGVHQKIEKQNGIKSHLS
jgi:hydroxymethylpyrimidine/phosphomethylpyrimidine kinase